MKRLIPAAIILVFTLTFCLYSHAFITRACDETLKDLDAFGNQNISADTLQKSWQNRKEKMSIFVNHAFLDDISIYIGQLTLNSNSTNEHFKYTSKNIHTILAMIKKEQQLSAHSFY